MDQERLEFLSQFVSDHKRGLFEQVLSLRTRCLTVVLEDVYQPHNASACLRSCDCFGVQDVHIIENRNEFEPHPEIALGASQWLTLHQYTGLQPNTEQCYRQLRSDGFLIAAATPHTGECLLRDLDVTRPTALVFGAELNGLSDQAVELADVCFRVPLFGFTESFNISVAVAICLYELTNRLRESSRDWQLSDVEKDSLRVEWIKQALGSKLGPLLRRFEQDRLSG